MTHQAEPVAWTQVPLERRRRLITLLGQMAYRHLSAVRVEEGNTYDDHDINTPGPGEQGTRSTPGSLGGGIGATIDGAASGAAPGVDPAPIWPGGTRPQLGVGTATGAGD